MKGPLRVMEELPGGEKGIEARDSVVSTKNHKQFGGGRGARKKT